MKYIKCFVEWINELGRRDVNVEYWLSEDELKSSRFVDDPWFGISTATNRHWAARWALTFMFAVFWFTACIFLFMTKGV